MATANHTPVNTIIRLFLLAIFILSPLPALADKAIQTDPLQGFEFASAAEAVKAMKEHCLADSRRGNAEHMGAILQTTEGRYLVTHGEAAPEQESVTFTIRRPADSKLVALWHTHGAPGRQTERFSIDDGNTVRETGLPFYLITPKGEIKVLERRAKGQKADAGRSGERAFVRNFKGLALFRLI